MQIFKLSLQLNWWPQNKLFDTSGTVIYTSELVSHYRLSVVQTIQCLASIFVVNNFNLLISIAVTSLNKSFCNYMPEREESNGVVNTMKMRSSQ